MVTGGTGFVGCHIVSMLLQDGHDVRLLVRSAARVARALEPLGVSSASVQVVEGDVTDRVSVRHAMANMEGLVHAASVFTMDKHRSNEILATNKTGTMIVLNEASNAHLDPIVHVSSIAAVLPPHNHAVVSEDSAPARLGIGPYVDSKAEQEVVARKFQAMGVPVVITYPGAVMGPHDPHWGDGPFLIESILRNKAPIAVKGRIPIVDVRDVGRLHAAIMAPGHGPRRFMFSGTSVTFAALVTLLSQITKRNIRCTELPSWLVSPIVNLLDELHTVLPFRFRVTSEGLTILKRDCKFKDSTDIGPLGIPKTDLGTTMADMVRWMRSTGRISAEIAGALASS